MAEQQDLVVAMSCSNLEIWRFKNVEICRTSTLAVRRIALLVVGRKVVKKNFFFSDVAKKIGKTWQKSVEKSSKKSWSKNELVKKISLFLKDNKSIN